VEEVGAAGMVGICLESEILEKFEKLLKMRNKF
jgi:hypothetical protein